LSDPAQAAGTVVAPGGDHSWFAAAVPLDGSRAAEVR